MIPACDRPQSVTGGHKCSQVDLTSYCNSSTQVRALLDRLRSVIDAVATHEGPEAGARLSELALVSRQGAPRSVRDRIGIDEVERLLVAARAGVPQARLVEEFGVSRKTIYRLLRAGGA
jgi:hypothetical protein